MSAITTGPYNANHNHYPISMIQSLNEAIKNKSLASYLKAIDPEILVKELANDWTKSLEILTICNEKIALPIIAKLTEDEMLGNYPHVFDSIDALKVFNTPDRLPVFIEALKLAREHPLINVDNLLNHHNNKNSPFHGQLLNFVQKALQIEQGCGSAAIDETIAKVKENITNSHNIHCYKKANKTVKQTLKEERKVLKEKVDSNRVLFLNEARARADEKYETLLKTCHAESV